MQCFEQPFKKGFLRPGILLASLYVKYVRQLIVPKHKGKKSDHLWNMLYRHAHARSRPSGLAEPNPFQPARARGIPMSKVLCDGERGEVLCRGGEKTGGKLERHNGS